MLNNLSKVFNNNHIKSLQKIVVIHEQKNMFFYGSYDFEIEVMVFEIIKYW